MRRRGAYLEGVAGPLENPEAWVGNRRENPTYSEDLPRCFLRILSPQYQATRMLRL